MHGYAVIIIMTGLYSFISFAYHFQGEIQAIFKHFQATLSCFLSNRKWCYNKCALKRIFHFLIILKQMILHNIKPKQTSGISGGQIQIFYVSYVTCEHYIPSGYDTTTCNISNMKQQLVLCVVCFVFPKFQFNQFS